MTFMTTLVLLYDNTVYQMWLQLGKLCPMHISFFYLEKHAKLAESLCIKTEEVKIVHSPDIFHIKSFCMVVMFLFSLNVCLL
jgi:hypothetical protein